MVCASCAEAHRDKQKALEAAAKAAATAAAEVDEDTYGEDDD
ncbi:MAG: hypothetical protein RIK87_16245 [Fuerstiella sp.]